jgi:hypothetical protein
MRGRPILLISILLLAAIGLGLFIYSRWSASPSGESSYAGTARAKDDPNRIKSGPNYKPIEPILGMKDSDTKKTAVLSGSWGYRTSKRVISDVISARKVVKSSTFTPVLTPRGISGAGPDGRA